MFLYKATLNRVVSPVTLLVNVDLGFGVSKKVPIRLNGISMPSTPEKRAKAVELISDWVAKHPVFVLHTLKVKAPFDRYLGVVFNRWGGSLNKKLLRAGVAQPIPDEEVPKEETPETEPPEESEDEVFVDETPEEVVEEEVSEEELPPVETEDEHEEVPEEEKDVEHLPAEELPESGDLLEDVPDQELAEEIAEETQTRKRWRLKSKA